MSSLHGSIRSSNVWTALRLLTSLGIGFFITTFIVRKLSVEEFGIYSVLFSMISLVGALASFGIQDVFRRFLPEYLQRQEFGLLKRIVNYGLSIRLLLSMIVVAIILLLNEEVGRLLKVDNFLAYFAVFGVAIIAYLESGLLTTMLHSIFLHKYSAIANLVYVLFRGGLAFVVLDKGWGVSGLLWVEAISWTFWAIVQWAFYYRCFASKHAATDSGEIPLGRFARYSGMSSFNDVGSSVLGVSTDFLIITAYLGPAAVALYAFADRVMKMINQVLPHVVLADVIRPSFFTKYAETGARVDLEKMFNLVLKLSALTIFPICLGIFALSEDFISIVFKSQYVSASGILNLLALFSVLSIFAYPSGLVLQSVERVDVILFSKVFAIANVLLSLLVVRPYGVYGVVWSTCICTFFKNYYCYHQMRKICKIDLCWLELCRILGNSLLMLLLLLIAKPYILGIYHLVAAAGFAAAAYYAFTRWNSPFSIEERAFINRVNPVRLALV